MLTAADGQTDRRREVVAQLRLLHPSGREMRETFREWRRTALPNRCCHHTGATIDLYCQRLFLFSSSFSYFFSPGICILWTTECDKACNTLDEMFSSSKHNFPISPRRKERGDGGWRGPKEKKNKKTKTSNCNLILQLTLHIDFYVMTTWANTSTNSLR